MTIKDIAKVAGVSHMTVSRVINNSGEVKKETREKVEKVIEEFSFKPNRAAKALIMGKPNRVAVVTAYDICNYPSFFTQPILAGLTQMLYANGISMEVVFGWRGIKRAEIEKLIGGLKNVAGLFVIGVDKDEQSAYLGGQIDIPLVFINQGAIGVGLNCVVSDDGYAIYQIVDVLIKKGHKRIAFLTGILDTRANVTRLLGYKKALQDNDLMFDEKLVIEGGYEAQKGFKAVEKFLETDLGCTAICTESDIMAFAAMKAIRQKGLRIPQDIAVSGFDDTEFSIVSDPPLTTARKELNLMGVEAAKIMMTIMDGKSEKNLEVVLKPLVIFREST